eukprot:m51a1_g11807 hypothetical protein (583) ;mRNA; f:351866-353884
MDKAYQKLQKCYGSQDFSNLNTTLFCPCYASYMQTASYVCKNGLSGDVRGTPAHLPIDVCHGFKPKSCDTREIVNCEVLLNECYNGTYSGPSSLNKDKFCPCWYHYRSCVNDVCPGYSGDEPFINGDKNVAEDTCTDPPGCLDVKYTETKKCTSGFTSCVDPQRRSTTAVDESKICPCFANYTECVTEVCEEETDSDLKKTLHIDEDKCKENPPCEEEHKDDIKKCFTVMEDCYGKPVYQAGASGEIADPSKFCPCYFDYLTCVTKTCTNMSIAIENSKKWVSPDTCKQKSPDCYFQVWGDPHFIKRDAQGQRSFWDDQSSSFPNLYSSGVDMTVSADTTPFNFWGYATTLLKTVTVKTKQGRVYTISPSLYGGKVFDTSSPEAGWTVTATSIRAPSGESISVANRWTYLDIEIFGYCKGESTVQRATGSPYMGGWGFRSDKYATAAKRSAACAGLPQPYGAACEFDTRSGKEELAESSKFMSQQARGALEFLQAFGSPAAAASATIGVGAIVGIAVAATVGVAAVGAGAGAAVYVAKKRSSSKNEGKNETTVDDRAPRGVNVMGSGAVHQSITGRAPPVAV